MERQKKQKDSEDADSFVGSFSIPCDETEWAALVLKGRIRGKTLHDGIKMSSGSMVLKKQFLLFRVLWPQRVEPDGFLPCIDKYGLDKTWDTATTIVDGSAELQRYISLVANKVDVKTLSETDESGAGSFIPVLPFQQQCLIPIERVSTERHTIFHETRLKRKAAEIFGLLRPSASDTETDPTEYKAEDEAIVNTALILFLQAVSNLAGPLLVGWTLKRFQFSPRFNKAHYITFTDGDLWDAITRRIYVIIELKKHQFRLNTAKGIKIPMQESAQSVGLLKRTEEDPRLFKNHLLVVSQDANEIYIIFGKPGHGYQNYIDTGVVTEDSFLEMQRYGPWLTNNSKHRLNLAIVIIAIVLTVRELQD